MDDSEESLVRESQRQGRHAFEELVRRTARIVFSRLYLETGDAHRAEDLAQETFLVAWRSLHQVTDPKGFRPWLLAIAHTVALDAARRQSRRKRAGRIVDGESVFPKLADDSEGPVEAAAQKEQRERVLSMLRSMPQEYREPLMLRYFAGADYDAIGQQLGLSNGSLRGLLHRGITRLREQMGTQEPEASSQKPE